MRYFFKNNNISILLFILVLSISYLSFYNYKTQNNLLLKQMGNNAKHIASSISASIKHFEDIKSTVSLQKLVRDLSFGLEIFDFRFIKYDGIIKNSMFKEEIGKISNSKSFQEILQGEKKLKTFFFEKRDFVKVMAIYYPIYRNKDLVGIIDLSVDIVEYNDMLDNNKFILEQRKIDILNLLKSIESSIVNNLSVIEETDTDSFLNAHINFTTNIEQILLVDNNTNKIINSSNKGLVATTYEMNNSSLGLFTIDKKLIYKTVVQNNTNNTKLVLLINAFEYAKNEHKLLQTAITTSAIALLFAFFIAMGVYNSAMRQSRSEKERLEYLVKERTLEIELLSKIDALTGLWNRGYLEEMLEMEFKRAHRYNHDISIMIIDLDFFKKINDTYGHLGGDEVLRIVSNRIIECVRDTDFVGRYGGEEIVVILPETAITGCQNIANKILQSISAKPIKFESDLIDVTASIGISKLKKGHKNQKALFYEADLALYRAKREGRNRVILFDETVEA